MRNEERRRSNWNECWYRKETQESEREKREREMMGRGRRRGRERWRKRKGEREKGGWKEREEKILSQA